MSISQEHLLGLLQQCRRNDPHGIFSNPVDTNIVSDYLSVIEKPMDFRTAQSKIEQGLYQTEKEFWDDVFLICDNCMLYNSPETEYHHAAEALRRFAENPAAPEQVGKRRRRKIYSTYTSLNFDDDECNGVVFARKRSRTKAADVVRQWPCPMNGCNRAYGSKPALGHHITMKHPMDAELLKGSIRRISDGSSPVNITVDTNEREPDELILVDYVEKEQKDNDVSMTPVDVTESNGDSNGRILRKRLKRKSKTRAQQISYSDFCEDNSPRTRRKLRKRTVREAPRMPEGNSDSDTPVFKYQVIDRYVPVIDKHIVRRKMQTSKIGNCDGKHCDDLKKLGPYSDEKATFDSLCPDRFALEECSHLCKCSPETCQNRAISLGKRKKIDLDVKLVTTYGIDPYTRKKLAEIVPPELTHEKFDYFIKNVLLRALNEYCIYRDLAGSGIPTGIGTSLSTSQDQKAESITNEAPTSEAPTSEAPTCEAPTSEAPTSEAPTCEAPTSEAPTCEAPTSEAPTSEAPTCEAPTSEAPTSEAPTSEAPTREAPTTEAPTTEAPTTKAPTYEAPTPEAPTTEAPTSEAPTSETPTSETPTSETPTSKTPTSEKHTSKTPSAQPLGVKPELPLSDIERNAANIKSKSSTVTQQPSSSPSTNNLSIDLNASSMSSNALPTSNGTPKKESNLLFNDIHNALSSPVNVSKFAGDFTMSDVLQMITNRSDIDEEWRQLTKHMIEQQSYLHSDEAVADFKIHSKGVGIVCIDKNGFPANTFVVEYFGEVYPPWRWYEKQDAIKTLEKRRGIKNKVPDFYNIQLERHCDDEKGFDVLFVDPTKKGTFGSRLSHSCAPNCTTTMMAVNGTYVVAVIAIRDIKYGEELTFDYNSVTDNEDEHRSAVCLCGNTNCRGSFLFYSGSTTFQQVMKPKHSFLHRVSAVLNASINPVTAEDRKVLYKIGLKQSVLEGLPDWAIKWTSIIAEYIEYERHRLPIELAALPPVNGYKYSLASAQIEAAGVRDVRLQNIAITMDKIKYFLSKNQKYKHPPLRLLTTEEIVGRLWNNKDSLVNQFLDVATPHDKLDQLVRIQELAMMTIPETEEGLQIARQKLTTIRDQLRKLKPTPYAFHHAASDLFHFYANTKFFFTDNRYSGFKSLPFELSDLGFGPGIGVGPKDYSAQYIWGMLIYWMRQTIEKPDASLSQNRRGACSLPSIHSCYAKSGNGPISRDYGQNQRREMLNMIVDRPYQYWPISWHWGFRNKKMYGSPMLDNVLEPSQRRFSTFVHEMQCWTPSYVK